jgi:hypothetical protein
LAKSSDSYFELTYEPPWKGINVDLPENKIDRAYTPFANNWIPRGGELRTRPRLAQLIPGLLDGSQPTALSAFADANNTIHTVAVSTTGLWQLNSNWRVFHGKEWSLVGRFITPYPVSSIPATIQLFLNQIFFVTGDFNLWNWNGLQPNSLTALPALQSIAKYDTVNNLLAGALFLGELDSRLVLLNTIEQQNVPNKAPSNFQQRIRWSASGLPTVWDPTVNIGAGFSDELDVPDQITGFLTIGRNGFIFRSNGITEMTSISQGVLPFDFNHLWASDRGIGNVQPFSIAGYGPVGCFISLDDIYELSLGGFKKIGGLARNAIYTDLNNSISTPVASMFPAYGGGYPYLTYKISIVLPGNIMKSWCYFVEADCWFSWTSTMGFETARCRMVPTQ